ncbi:MAG: hypothetical protein RLY86_3614 [Pseudomonadota bacterium]|jgi:hypothetical protein
MEQSVAMSLVEWVANVAVGYGVAVVTQIMIFPIFGMHTTADTEPFPKPAHKRRSRLT